VRRGFVRGFILRERLLVRLVLVAVEKALDTILVPFWRESGLD